MLWGVQGNRNLAESSIAIGCLELSTYMLSSKYTSPSFLSQDYQTQTLSMMKHIPHSQFSR